MNMLPRIHGWGIKANCLFGASIAKLCFGIWLMILKLSFPLLLYLRWINDLVLSGINLGNVYISFKAICLRLTVVLRMDLVVRQLCDPNAFLSFEFPAPG